MKISKYMAVVLFISVPVTAYTQQFSLPAVEPQNEEELSQSLLVDVERIDVRGVTAINPEVIAALKSQL